MKFNIILANLVFTFHVFVVLFILFAPFTNIPYLLLLHFVSCICLMVHWYGNSDVCSLSVLESYLRDIKHTETFTHQFVGPVYNICDSDWNKIVWIITITVMLISLYKIYYSEAFRQAWKNIRNGNNIFISLKPIFEI